MRCVRAFLLLMVPGLCTRLQSTVPVSLSTTLIRPNVRTDPSLGSRPPTFLLLGPLKLFLATIQKHSRTPSSRPQTQSLKPGHKSSTGYHRGREARHTALRADLGGFHPQTRAGNHPNWFGQGHSITFGAPAILFDTLWAAGAVPSDPWCMCNYSCAVIRCKSNLPYPVRGCPL